MTYGAIFDFDGTLFDSMHVWATVGSDYLRSLGHTPKEDLDEVFKALSLRQAALYYKEEYGVKQSVSEIEDGINAVVEEKYFKEVLPREGVPKLLQLLKDGGFRMCIATATDRYLIEAALSRTELCGFFEGILTCPEEGSGKDEPAIFESALRLLGTGKEKAFVFEDSLHALKTARSAGFKTVGVCDRYESRQAEVRRNSDIYIEDFRDPEGLYKQLKAGA